MIKLLFQQFLGTNVWTYVNIYIYNKVCVNQFPGKKYTKKNVIFQFGNFEVRDAICVAGHQHADIAFVKSKLCNLTTKPEKVEGFHVKNIR